MKKMSFEAAVEAIRIAKEEAAQECIEIVIGPPIHRGDPKEVALVNEIVRQIEDRFQIGHAKTRSDAVSRVSNKR